QVGFSQTFGGVEVPVGRDLTKDLTHFIAGQSGFVLQGNGFRGVLDHKGAINDLGLQYIPCAFKEEESVVVGRCTSIQIERQTSASGVVHQVLSLGGTNGD